MSNTRGQSFKDPIYDQIEARLEQKYGLPAGGMSAIRTRGERSNANQVSSAGARSVYQIIPSTRDAFLKKYGVDAYAGPEQASEVAALHLRDSLKRNGGNWGAAVGEYHGGPDRRNWGPVNRAYRERVTGQPGRAPVASVPQLRTPTVDELIHGTPDELFAPAEAAIQERRRAPRPKLPSVNELVTKELTGGDGTIEVAPLDDNPVNAEAGTAAQARKAEQERKSFGHWDRFKAGMSETLIGQLVDNIGAQDREFDPNFMRYYRDNWKEIESFAQSDYEVDQLREAGTADHLQAIKATILEDREREKVINSSGMGWAVRLGTGVLDPAGWAAGIGVGKGLQIVGMGARAAAAAGNTGRAVAYAGLEGAVGNLAVTAGLDSAGDYVSPEEYQLSAITGLMIGTALSPLSVRAGRNDELEAQLSEARTAREAHTAKLRAEVEADLGPGASPEAVAQGVAQRQTQAYLDVLNYSLADVPADQRLLVAEEMLTENPQVKAAVEAKHDLASVSDATERAMVTELTARAERVARSVDIKEVSTVLEKAGMESTALRLLKSNSPVAKAVALTLLENPTAAGGRRRTAAIAMAQRERLYNEHFAEWDRLADTFRRQEGVGRFRNFWDGAATNRFNSRVFREVERRMGKAGQSFDLSPLVVRAADLFESGMEKMRIEQQHVGTVGAARLGDSSVGYVPHRLDPRKVLGLTNPQRQRVRDVLASQFQDIDGFDAAFSERLAAKYLERAVDGANGRYHVPFNLHSPEAGQIVRDALEALNLPPDELDKIVGKFSRGGAGHTKRRLRLDLNADIGDGLTLADLFVTDMPTLYRSYARRVAGEVALAQHGIMGKKALSLLSKAITASGGTPDDAKAFDQIAAEFLNTPFGSHNHQWMDNLRVATSAARLGGMGFTQFAEFGNALPALGIRAALKGVADMPRLISEVQAIAKGGAQPSPLLKSLDTLGGHVGLENYHVTRMFDVKDNDIRLYGSEAMGIGTRTIRAAGHGVMVMSGHRMITAVQTRAMAEQIVRKAVKYARTGEADIALDDMGIHSGLREAIKADLDRIATFDSKGELLDLDLFKGKALTPSMIAELAQAVERGAGQIIQRTYIGETGAWAHNGLLKLLFQFRTFSITAVEKQWGRNTLNYGALKSFMYLMGAASFAVPIHLARVQANALSQPAGKREEYIEKYTSPVALARATMNYASASGLAGDIMDVGASVFSNYGGDFGERLGDAYNIRGKRSDQLIGGAIAPGVGLLNDLYAGVSGGDARKVARSLPGSNLPYVAPFINAALSE